MNVTDPGAAALHWTTAQRNHAQRLIMFTLIKSGAGGTLEKLESAASGSLVPCVLNLIPASDIFFCLQSEPQPSCECVNSAVVRQTELYAYTQRSVVLCSALFSRNAAVTLPGRKHDVEGQCQGDKRLFCCIVDM